MEWPSWNGRPLCFLGQIDLGKAPKDFWFDWMPREGRLLFFFDALQPTGGADPADRGSWRVLYFDPSVSTVWHDPPYDLWDDIFPEEYFKLVPAKSLPTLERLDLDWHIEDEVAEKYFELDDWGSHQLFGWPTPIQNDTMEEDCQLASNGVSVFAYTDPRRAELLAGAAEWELLLQIDSDEDLDMTWGDVGMLYFWVRRDDARRGDFSNVWMILQSH
jgi:uncharacterized protein YwqG